MADSPQVNARWLVVGLGNPGATYEQTRHNVGFMALDYLASVFSISLSKHAKSQSILGHGTLENTPIILLKPQTYMNLSGQAVGSIVRYYQIPLSQVLIIYDDVAIPLGKLRIRPNGSAGGQNGMKSIIQSFLGSQEFPRLRIGIGGAFTGPLEHYVLTSFSKKEKETIVQVVEKTEEIVRTILKTGVVSAMNQFNGFEVLSP